MLRYGNFFCLFVLFSSGQPFLNCARRGSESSNFHPNITDSYYLGSKHSEKYLFIHINMVSVNNWPAYSFCGTPEWLVFPDFHEGQLFVIYVFISQKLFHISIWIECRSVEDSFLIHSSDFCGHEYKFSSVKNFTFPPTPKSLCFRNHVSYKRQLCGLALW